MRRACTAIGIVLAVLACASAPASAAGPPAARLEIPKLGLDVSIAPTLSGGPMFYPGSARPGEPYTIAIAGHRTTHTHPFWALNELRRGDRIVVVWRGRPHAYRVTTVRVVAPTDWSLIRDRGYERLVLSACTPRFSARERLVVVALPTS